MKIAIISDWFAEQMGYAENCLPKALAELGAEVHVVTSDAQVYFDSPFYKETYEPFIGPGIVECGVKRIDGYTLHRLPHGRSKSRISLHRLYIPSLLRKLAELKPDVVQTFDVGCPTTYHAALGKIFLGYQLFLETHTHASVWSPRTRSPRIRTRLRECAIDVANKLASAISVKCYPISTDAADIAVKHLGVQRRKVEVCSLGVDTLLFRQPTDGAAQNNRITLRTELGFSQTDVVCIYTGRLTKDKGPLYLAKAISALSSQGSPFRGLFVGRGTASDVAEIEACSGCVVHPFVPTRDLPRFYWAADIGVWPKQESTSQLDAAACGLPLILSDRVEVRERIDGNGLTYRESDVANLAARISMLFDPSVRLRMGQIGAANVRGRFSWELIAKRRLEDYVAASTRSS
jgi:glycosyltransferase involved in cell wall biosynthesis